MKAIPLPPNEEERLRLLKNLEALETGPQELFEGITRAIALVCEVPVVLVSLGEEYRQWFEPRSIGPAARTDAAFYGHAVAQDEVFVVPDVAADNRFGAAVRAGIGFYAGVPLKLTATVRLGVISVIDFRPRTLDDKQLALLQLLAEHVVLLIRMRLDKLETNLDFGALVTVKQKLQFQKELMEAVFDNEPESVMILTADGDLEQINRAGLDMLEAGTLSEARSRKPADYVLPEFRDRFRELEARVYRGEHAIAEYRIRGLKGSERWMESHAAPLYDQQGRIVNLIAVTRDVTRLKQSQARLMLAARVFSDAQEGIIITDAGGTIIDVNPTFCAITGYSRDEVIGQNPRMLQSGRQAPEFYAAMWQALRETGHWKGEIWNRKKNGELYAELISISALRDENGKAINYVGLFLDVTSVRQQSAAT